MVLLKLTFLLLISLLEDNVLTILELRVVHLVIILVRVAKFGLDTKFF